MRIGPQRPVNADAIVAPQGYRVEALITGLSFPSAISFGPGGEIYLAERGCPPVGGGGLIGVPRVLRVDPDRSITEIGRLENPISGLVYRAGELLIGEDGPSPRILRVTAEGEVQVLVQGLPGGGDYGLSGLSLDSSGGLLFGLGTRTNSGVVGLDNVARGWVSAHPDWADIPGEGVELAGVNYVTSRPAPGAARLITGGFKPFGHRCEPGEKVSGAARCGGAVYRLAGDSGEPDRLAWGLRNPLGTVCSPDGKVFVTEGGMEERGSRPIGGAADNLWEIQPGGYYGWPDHSSGLPVNEPRFRLPGHPAPRSLLRRAPKVAGTPAATFPARSGAGGLDFSREEEFGFVGEILVALAGEWGPAAYPGEGGAAPGHRVVRVDPRTGQATDFLVNRSGAPASSGNTGGLERPFEIRFDPTGEVLYVVDMGEVHPSREHGLEAYGATGVLWRITRIQTTVEVPAQRKGRQERAKKELPEEETREEAAPAAEAAAEREPDESAGPGADDEPPDLAEAPVPAEVGEAGPADAQGETEPAGEAAASPEAGQPVVETEAAAGAEAGEPGETVVDAGTESERPLPTGEEGTQAGDSGAPGSEGGPEEAAEAVAGEDDTGREEPAP